MEEIVKNVQICLTTRKKNVVSGTRLVVRYKDADSNVK